MIHEFCLDIIEKMPIYRLVLNQKESTSNIKDIETEVKESIPNPFAYLRLNHFLQLIKEENKQGKGFKDEQIKGLKELFILFEKAYHSFPEHKGINFPNYKMTLSWLSPYVGHSYSYRFKYERRNQQYKKIWDKVCFVFESGVPKGGVTPFS